MLRVALSGDALVIVGDDAAAVVWPVVRRRRQHDDHSRCSDGRAMIASTVSSRWRWACGRRPVALFVRAHRRFHTK